MAQVRYVDINSNIKYIKMVRFGVWVGVLFLFWGFFQNMPSCLFLQSAKRYLKVLTWYLKVPALGSSSRKFAIKFQPPNSLHLGANLKLNKLTNVSSMWPGVHVFFEKFGKHTCTPLNTLLISNCNRTKEAVMPKQTRKKNKIKMYIFV